MSESRRAITRRKLLSDVAKGIGASTVAAGFPAIVPSSVFGATSPSNRSPARWPRGCPTASR